MFPNNGVETCGIFMATMLAVRKARRADLKIVFPLWKEFVQTLDNFAIGNKTLGLHLKRKRGAPEGFTWWAEQYIASKRGAVFLAQVDGEPAGYSFIYILRRDAGHPKINTFGYVEDLFVREEFRGRGISSRLMQENMKWFRARKMRHILLYVLDENQIPKSIYRKWGFFPFMIEMRKDI